jgi:hypothetical protein
MGRAAQALTSGAELVPRSPSLPESAIGTLTHGSGPVIRKDARAHHPVE